tara:strand:- start:1054 stop:1269 length:216 start_codon:yes stop_codon:yes gene_type:complete
MLFVVLLMLLVVLLMIWGAFDDSGGGDAGGGLQTTRLLWVARAVVLLNRLRHILQTSGSHPLHLLFLTWLL